MRKNINSYHFTDGLIDAITTLPGTVKTKQTELQKLKQSKADPNAIERCRYELSRLNHRLVDAWLEFGSEAKAWHISADLDLASDDDASPVTKLSRYDINRIKRISEHPSISKLVCRNASSRDKGVTLNAIIRKINTSDNKKKNNNECDVDVYGDGLSEDIAWVLLHRWLIEYTLTLGDLIDDYSIEFAT